MLTFLSTGTKAKHNPTAPVLGRGYTDLEPPRLTVDASQPKGSTPQHLTFVLAEIKSIPN